MVVIDEQSNEDVEVKWARRSLWLLVCSNRIRLGDWNNLILGWGYFISESIHLVLKGAFVDNLAYRQETSISIDLSG